MAVNTFTLEHITDIVAKSISHQIEEAMYSKIRPIVDKVARDAAKTIASQIKGYVSHERGYSKGNTYYWEPTILVSFNGEDLKL